MTYWADRYTTYRKNKAFRKSLKWNQVAMFGNASVYYVNKEIQELI